MLRSAGIYEQAMKVLYDTTMLSPRALRNEHNLHGALGALYDEGSGAVTPCKALATWRSIVEEGGGAVHEGTAISSVSVVNHRYQVAAANSSHSLTVQGAPCTRATGTGAGWRLPREGECGALPAPRERERDARERCECRGVPSQRAPSS